MAAITLWNDCNGGSAVARESFFSSRDCREEIRQCDEHEIVVQISEMIGAQPCTLCKAEEIFNSMKSEIARYIVTHEFACAHKADVDEELLLWLDEKTSPAGVRQLVETIEKYLK